VLHIFAELYQALSNASIESYRSSSTFVDDDVAGIPIAGEMYNAAVLIFELEDGEYDSIAVPALNESFVLSDNTLDCDVIGNQIAQILIDNNLSPRGNTSVIRYVGAYYAILEVLNQ
jgi:hypothetical protein